MCGRYNILPQVRPWLDALGVLCEFAWAPRYNVAPSQVVPVVIARDGRLVAVPMRWGFVPHWQKNPKPNIRPINARDDHVQASGMFRDSWKHRRCLVPAGGFYEWHATGAGKRPYHIHWTDDRPFVMGGVWDAWPLAEEVTESFAIITTTANAAVAPLHARMPVIVGERQMRDWLLDADAAQSLLAPCPASWLTADEISTRVNSPQHDDPDVIRPVCRH